MAAATNGTDAGLRATREKTDAVASEIESASDHASVIGTVLAHELPEELQVGEVAQAIEQTEELEKKLAESAEKLAEVSAALEQEIGKRREVTGALEASRKLVDKLSDESQGS
jgi:hypothetical protein